jgi:hypothetical protein
MKEVVKDFVMRRTVMICSERSKHIPIVGDESSQMKAANAKGSLELNWTRASFIEQISVGVTTRDLR